jgi:hypothetical protein
MELALQYGTKTNKSTPTVGSETLYRGGFSGPELLEKNNGVKSALREGLRLEWETAGRNTSAGDGCADYGSAGICISEAWCTVGNRGDRKIGDLYQGALWGSILILDR